MVCVVDLIEKRVRIVETRLKNAFAKIETVLHDFYYHFYVDFTTATGCITLMSKTEGLRMNPPRELQHHCALYLHRIVQTNHKKLTSARPYSLPFARGEWR